jgi:hypothetical protein
MGNDINHPFDLFLHIPTTARTTLRHTISQLCGDENVLTNYNQPSAQLLENFESHLITHPNGRALISHFKFVAADKESTHEKIWQTGNARLVL